ncbi:DUF4157 domain-containing protein [Anaerolineales bacterium HSG24]|nr:DUF4157 domain-containing protein [Anaerolineales bacterium HSG24]
MSYAPLQRKKTAKPKVTPAPNWLQPTQPVVDPSAPPYRYDDSVVQRLLAGNLYGPSLPPIEDYYTDRKADTGDTAPRVQPKLKVGPANDKYEQEADSVADRVMKMPDVKREGVKRENVMREGVMRELAVQRVDEEDELMMKPIENRQSKIQNPMVQRQEDEDELMMKPDVKRENVMRESAVQRVEEEDELMMKPLSTNIQRQEDFDEELMQGKPLSSTLHPPILQRQEEEDELMMKPLSIQRQEDEDELMMKPIENRQSQIDNPMVQRQEDEDELMMKPIENRQSQIDNPTVQRQEDEDELMMKPMPIQRMGEGGFETNSDFESRVNSSKGGGKALPKDTQADMGSKIGADFSGVRVHTGAESAQMSQDIGAKAFTHGNDIHFNSGQYDPGSGSGKRLLAHELTHTVQQSGGKNLQKKPLKIPPTVSQKNISDNVVQAELMSKDDFYNMTGMGMLKARPKEYKSIDSLLVKYHKLTDPEGENFAQTWNILIDIDTNLTTFIQKNKDPKRIQKTQYFRQEVRREYDHLFQISERENFGAKRMEKLSVEQPESFSFRQMARGTGLGVLKVIKWCAKLGWSVLKLGFTVVKGVLKLIFALGKGVFKIVLALVKTLGRLAGDLFVYLGEKLITLVKLAGNQLVEWVRNPQVFIEFVKAAGEKFWSFLAALGTKVKEAFVTAGPILWSWLKKGGELIIEAIIGLPDFLRWAKETGGKVIDVLVESGSQAITWLSQAGTYIVELIKKAPEAWQWIKESPKRMIQALQTYGKAIIDWITIPKTPGIIDIIKKYATQFWSWLLEAGAYIVQAVAVVGADIWDWLIQAGAKLIQSFKEHAPDIFGWLLKIGKGMILGLIEHGPKVWQWIKAGGAVAIEAFSKYASTIWQWIKVAGGAAIAAIVTYGPKIWRWLVQGGKTVIAVISKYVGLFWGWLREAGSWLVEAIVKGGPKLWGWLGEHGPKIVALLKKAGKVAVDWLANLPENIDNLSQVIDRFTDTASEKIEEGSETVAVGISKLREWIKTLPQKVVTFIESYGPKFKEWLATLPNKALSALKDFSEDTWAFVVALPDNVRTFITQTGPHLLEMLKNAPSTIWKAVKTYGPQLLDWLVNLPNNVLDILKNAGVELWEWLKTLPGEVLNIIKTYGPLVWTFIKELPSNMLVLVQEYGPQVWQWLKELPSNLWSAIIDGGIVIWTLLRNAPSSLLETIKEYGAKIFEALKEFGTQLIAWIKEQGLVGILKWFFEWVIDFGIDVIKQVFSGLGGDVLKSILEGGIAVINAVKAILNLGVNIVKNGWSLIKALFTHPVNFFKYAIEGIGSGIGQFADSIAENAVGNIWDWLFDGLSVNLPKEFSIKALVNVAFEVLGMGYEFVKSKIVEVIGEDTTNKLESVSGSALATWKDDGPWYALTQKDSEATPETTPTQETTPTASEATVGQVATPTSSETTQEETQSSGPPSLGGIAASLMSALMDAVKGFVVEKVTNVIVMLVPYAGEVKGALESVQAVVDTVTVFINQAKNILEIITNVISQVSDIVTGNIATLATQVKDILTDQGLPELMKFVVSRLGLNVLPKYIKQVIEAVRQPITALISAVVKWIAETIQIVVPQPALATVGELM